jgi:hypothetical protein
MIRDFGREIDSRKFFFFFFLALWGGFLVYLVLACFFFKEAGRAMLFFFIPSLFLVFPFRMKTNEGGGEGVKEEEEGCY